MMSIPDASIIRCTGTKSPADQGFTPRDLNWFALSIIVAVQRNRSSLYTPFSPISITSRQSASQKPELCPARKPEWLISYFPP
jgi:hypothetical protein